MFQISPLWFYTLFPIAAAIAGAGAASVVRPGKILRSAIQHFAAGVVFAAAASEVLPTLKHEGALWPTLIGGGIGIAVMLAIEEIGGQTEGPFATTGLIAIDMFIDGLVLGLGFEASAKAGFLLTIALTLEILFLALSLTVALIDKGVSRWKSFSMTSAVVMLLPAGILASQAIARLSPTTLTGFFAFSLIALLYLVTEELLAEAHFREEPPWVTALFFIGFLMVLGIEDLTR